MTDTTNTLPKYSDMMYKLMQEQDTFDSNVAALIRSSPRPLLHTLPVTPLATCCPH
jgi:hypothetical protein